ncbi:4'-phosphopantetheinyl transferase superfamily protein [Streptomyces sp. L-9-10]|uniref:4'-phosphopantetheinyl transferase family protein n=1 Tax=Streptomyces sp. L-9-10 TaxID=1478131 RepID=UPI00101DD52F|nr:4'-phosphopantetheinyl transferase superfamily protein [Streptomyces sp. L-9-10]
MIEEILPPGVRSAEAFDDLAPAPLFPEEAALMAGRRRRRRAQFATARACARRALAELGLAPGPLLPGAGGAPQWPDGVVGSITHCDGYRAAVAARATDVAALGIDAEPAGPLPRGVLGLIASTTERAALDRLAAERPGVCWDRLLFSAKEAVYKAWFPATERWLGFAEAEVRLTPTGTFTAALTPSSPPPRGATLRFAGRWLARGDLVVTSAVGCAVRGGRGCGCLWPGPVSVCGLSPGGAPGPGPAGRERNPHTAPPPRLTDPGPPSASAPPPAPPVLLHPAGTPPDSPHAPA